MLKFTFKAQRYNKILIYANFLNKKMGKWGVGNGFFKFVS